MHTHSTPQNSTSYFHNLSQAFQVFSATFVLQAATKILFPQVSIYSIKLQQPWTKEVNKYYLQL